MSLRCAGSGKTAVAWWCVTVLLAGCGPVQSPDSNESAVQQAATNVPVRMEVVEFRGWTATLRGGFRRRIEQGSLVLWKPGCTIWVSVWDNDPGLTPLEQLAALRARASADAWDREVADDALPLRFGYRLNEADAAARQPAFYGMAVGRHRHILLAAYFDDPEAVAEARDVWRSLQELPIE